MLDFLILAELTGPKNWFFVILVIVVFIILGKITDGGRGMVEETFLGAPARLLGVLVALAFLGYVHSCLDPDDVNRKAESTNWESLRTDVPEETNSQSDLLP